MNGFADDLELEIDAVKFDRFGVARGSDAFGDGYFGSGRGGHKVHRGMDFAYEPDALVRSPMPGPSLVTKLGYPYSDDLSFRYIELMSQNRLYIMRLFYVKPSVQPGDTVWKDDAIGTSQDIASRYGSGMVNHVHLEVYVEPRLLMPPYKRRP